MSNIIHWDRLVHKGVRSKDMQDMDGFSSFAHVPIPSSLLNLYHYSTANTFSTVNLDQLSLPE